MFKKIFIILVATFIFAQYINVSHGAGGDSGGTDNYSDPYKQASKLVKRAKKLEKKNKTERATKLYSQALEQLKQAYKADRNNPDILNYMGFTSRKSGNFNEAEKFYLKGLSLDPKHNGINEYLGELYVQTNRIEKAKERLAVLKNCGCKEFQELELIIKTRGSKIY